MTVPLGHDDVARLMDAYLCQQLRYVAARLQLADWLANGPPSAANLASALGAEPSSLHRILRGLAIVGIAHVSREQRRKRPNSHTCLGLSVRVARSLTLGASRQRYDKPSGCATTASARPSAPRCAAAGADSAKRR